MLSALLLSIFPAALLIAAATDLHDFKIPNWISLVLIAGYVAAGVAMGAAPTEIAEGLALGAAVLVVGFGLFAVRFFGGGDAKLFAASAPWIGAANYLDYLLVTAIAGGYLAILILVFRKTPPLPVYAQAPWIMRMHQNQHELPYGVAISAGGLMTFSQTPLFKLAFGG
ncbi:MAG: prepilin peptidase [Pseudomonadota bacterium]